MQWLTDLSEFANPLQSKTYKVVLLVDSLKPVLERYVVNRSQSIQTLHVETTDQRVHFQGTFLPKKDHVLHSLGYNTMGFRAEMTVSRSIRSQVYLRSEKFRLHDPATRSGGLMRLASKFLPVVQRRFLRALNKAAPKIFDLPDEPGQIIMNLDYFIQKVPYFVTTFGEISLLHVRIAPGDRVHFFVQTNLFMRNMVDFFGPEYLAVEEIQDRDALSMLWDPV